MQKKIYISNEYIKDKLLRLELILSKVKCKLNSISLCFENVSLSKTLIKFCSKFLKYFEIKEDRIK